MPDDLILLLVGSLVATRLVVMLLGGARADRAPYLALLGADLAALATARSLGDRGAALGFVAECVGAVLVVAPGLLDGLQARAERRGDDTGRRRALRVARLRELLVPGRAATDRRRALEQLGQAREGDVARVLAELGAEAGRTDDPDRARQLHVELVQVLLAADRRDDALAHAERHLGPDAYERSAAVTAAVAEALCARGRLRHAAPLLALLETQAAGRDVAAQPLLLPTRLAFIAGAGLTTELSAILDQRAIAAEVGPAVRQRLLALAAAAPPVEDLDVRMVARELADRLLDVGVRASVPLRRRMPLTLALIAVNVAVLGLTTLLGLGQDELGLARAGALFRPAVVAGEWWRLGSAMFLHAGLFHLAANMYGLYLLGRATEEILGWPRLLLIYALSGLGGGLASLWADRGLSVGASGAIMGLLASLTVIVFARRHQFHPVARRVLLGNLLFLGALQVFLGWQIPMIDSAAHAGGFVAGLLATAGLMPTRDPTPGARRALMAGAIGVLLAFVVAGAMAARRPLSDTLLRLPTAEVTVGDVSLTVPRGWTREPSGLLVDRHLGIELRVEHVRESTPAGESIRLRSPQADDPRVRPLLERISRSARPASAPR